MFFIFCYAVCKEYSRFDGEQVVQIVSTVVDGKSPLCAFYLFINLF